MRTLTLLAAVTLRAAASGATQRTTTDGDGRYAFNGIASASYDISVARDGFNTATRVLSLTSDARTVDLTRPSPASSARWSIQNRPDRRQLQRARLSVALAVPRPPLVRLPWLYNYRPLWDIVVLTFMIGGTTLCVTSLILEWRVLGRKLAAVLPSAAPADASLSEDLV